MRDAARLDRQLIDGGRLAVIVQIDIVGEEGAILIVPPRAVAPRRSMTERFKLYIWDRNRAQLLPILFLPTAEIVVRQARYDIRRRLAHGSVWLSRKRRVAHAVIGFGETLVRRVPVDDLAHPLP
jgi:hypothetical protein